MLRKPDNKGAQFKVELQADLKFRTSEVLSEGEHRALALASFLTEVRSMCETATIIIDDPVSSLDHGRSILVATRGIDMPRSVSVTEVQVKALYGRMRDCWERLVEEKVFNGVVTRFDQRIQTKKLRYVEVGDKVYERIEAGMTRTSTYSHDNPAAGTAPVPGPQDVAADLQELVRVIELIDDANKATERRRKAKGIV